MIIKASLGAMEDYGTGQHFSNLPVWANPRALVLSQAEAKDYFKKKLELGTRLASSLSHDGSISTMT